MCALPPPMLNYCISFITISWHVILTSHHISEFGLILPVWISSLLGSLSVTRGCLSNLYQPNNKSRHISAWQPADHWECVNSSAVMLVDPQKRETKEALETARLPWAGLLGPATVVNSHGTLVARVLMVANASRSHPHSVFPTPGRNDRHVWSS